MSAPFTAAVVGTGFIGPVHLEALRRLGVPVAGVLGSTPEKSIAAAQRWGMRRGYASLEELLADDTVDVVHLTTPNRLHFEQAAAVLRAGKHVLCEKPLAMNSQETAELVRIAAASGKAAGVCYNVRYYPLNLEAAERVRRGDVGDLYHVNGSYVQDWLLQPTDFSWRVLEEEGGPLRAVADIGTHWLDLIQFITGRPIEGVCADLQTALPTRQRPTGNVETFSSKLGGPRPSEPTPITTDDYGSLLIRFAGGGRGVLWVSQVTAGRKNMIRYELAGSRAALAWESERPNELWIGHRDQPNEVLVRDPSLLTAGVRQHADYPGGHNEGFPDSFKQLFRSFYQAISEGTYQTAPAFPTFADGHREVQLCEAVMQSHRERRWVTLPE